MSTSVQVGPTIQVDSDYDGAFEAMVRGWLKRAGTCRFEKIVISAGPYRASAVSYEILDDGKTIAFDFYSALRTGFGSLSSSEVDQLVNLLRSE